MATLTEMRAEMDQKRKALADIFTEAGPDIDMSKVTLIEGDTAAKAAEIRRRNEEMTELGKDIDDLVVLKAISENNGRPQPLVDSGGSRLPWPDVQPSAAQSKSLGRRLVESDVVKGYQKASRRSPVVDLDLPEMFERKTLFTETGFAPQAVRTGMILPGALRRPVVADLIPQGRTDQIAIVYMLETTTTNAAAAVAEGAAKPESALAFTEQTAAVRKVATVLPVTDELIADVPAMEAYVEARLRLFLQLAEETQLLSGSGVAPNVTGFLNTAGIQTQAKGADPTPDAIYKAIVLIQINSFLDASGVVIHPLDWQDIRLLRTADGIYIWGSPMDAGPERIWGLPVVSTTAMTQNTALVGAFDSASQMFRRADVAFAISTENEDFFIKNKLMLRVEERFALCVYRPAAFCTVTGV